MVHMFSSVLRTLLRETMKPTYRVGMLEGRKPDISQTFDTVAFTACFLFIEDFFFEAPLFEEQRTRI